MLEFPFVELEISDYIFNPFAPGCIVCDANFFQIILMTPLFGDKKLNVFQIFDKFFLKIDLMSF